MEIFQFNKEYGKQITQYNSYFIMSRIVETKKEAHIGCMYLEENGIIGLHQAVIPQLLLIVSGVGYVRGEKNEWFQVRSGDAVYWDKKEWHETKTDLGLTAIVIESEEIMPALMMRLKEKNI